MIHTQTNLHNSQKSTENNPFFLKSKSLGQTLNYQENVEITNKHIKWFSSLVTKEVYVKTTIRYHFTPTKMAKIKKLTISNVYESM